MLKNTISNQLDIKVLDPQMMPLVKPIYKAHYPSARPNKSEVIVVAYLESKIIGLVRFKPLDPYFLLTGMLVIPEYRGLGIGHQLLAFCRQEILNQKYFCFSYQHLERFYGQHGFSSQAKIPSFIQSRFEKYKAQGKALVCMGYVN